MQYFEKKGKISVIIPVYNAEEYVADILEDVLAQTYKDLEIILIDDGSKDSSLKILKKYELRDDRIIVLHCENGGPSKARNIGLKYATGEFIRFLDADDRIHTDSMEHLISPMLEDDTIDMVIGNYCCIPEQGYLSGKELRQGTYDKNTFIDIFIDNVRTFFIGVPWNKLYRRQIIEKNRFEFDENLIWCEDFVFNIEYYKKASTIYIVYVNKGIYNYYMRKAGITHNLDNIVGFDFGKMNAIRYEKAKEYCASMKKER